MTADFRIVLISDEQYCLSLLKEYCHARNYEISQIAADTESINKMIAMQPDMIILMLPSLKTSDLELIREIRIKHVIPVCCLRKINNAYELDRKIESWIDVFLDDPLDIKQLDNFMRSRFSHHDYFVQEKRSKERRAVNDRRLSSLQKPKQVGDKMDSTSKCSLGIHAVSRNSSAKNIA
jgi:DNA-binding response OmpR family regulator